MERPVKPLKNPLSSFLFNASPGAYKLQDLSRYRKKGRGFSDLLNFALFVAPGVIANKDGSFMRGWSYIGPDLDSATVPEIVSMTQAVNKGLLFLGTNWVLNVNAIRSSAVFYNPPGHFPDPTSWLIDDERRRFFNSLGAQYASRYVLTLTWLPPADVEEKVKGFMYEGEKTRSSAGEESLRQFMKQSESFELILKNYLGLRAMDDDEMLSFLVSCVSGERHSVKTPDIPMFLDCLVAGQSGDFHTGIEPMVGKRHIRVLSLDTLPQQIYPGIMDILNSLTTEYRWSTRFMPLDKIDAKKQLELKRRNWMQKRQGVFRMVMKIFNPQSGEGGWQNEDAVNMAEDSNQAVSENESGLVRFGYLTTTIILSDENKKTLEETVSLVRKSIAELGFVPRIEDNNAAEAFLGSIPGHGQYDIRKLLVSTSNLADILPTTSVWPGLGVNRKLNGPPLIIARTKGSSVFRFNLHVGDVGHSFLLGPSGSGKSTKVCLIVSQFFRYPNAQVFHFDKGYSALPLCYAMGGEHYDIAAQGESLSFYPLAKIEDDFERLWATDWISSLLALQYEGTQTGLGPAINDEIYKSLSLMSGSPHRTLSHLLTTVQNEIIRDGLRFYTYGNAMGGLLDSDVDSLGKSRYQVFEMDHLMELGTKSVMPVLEYIFHRIEQRLDGSPTLIVLDEAWKFLSHETFAKKIDNWLRTLRKLNASVLFATQDPADIVESSIRSVILGQTKTKVYLPFRGMDSQTENLYASLGLNERQIWIVGNSEPKRDYYYVSEYGKRLYTLDLNQTPAGLSFVGVSSPENIARIRELRREHGVLWPSRWLAERGLVEEAKRWESVRGKTGALS